MGITTLVLLFLTVLVGVAVLAEFAHPKRLDAMTGATAMVALHLVLALAAAVVWIVYLLDDRAAAAWAGFVALLAVVAAGVALYLRSRRVPSGDDTGITEISSGVLIVHGVVAAAAVLAGFLAAVGLGR